MRQALDCSTASTSTPQLEFIISYPIPVDFLILLVFQVPPALSVLLVLQEITVVRGNKTELIINIESFLERTQLTWPPGPHLLVMSVLRFLERGKQNKLESFGRETMPSCGFGGSKLSSSSLWTCRVARFARGIAWGMALGDVGAWDSWPMRQLMRLRIDESLRTMYNGVGWKMDYRTSPLTSGDGLGSDKMRQMWVEWWCMYEGSNHGRGV